jgi:dihydroorotate dehydrogenase (fumarate)
MRSRVPRDRANCGEPRNPMNLATNYLGLSLSNPFVVGASPCCDDLEVAQRLQDAGASAMVMRSLFEEQIHASSETSAGRRRGGFDAAPDSSDYQFSPDEYLRQNWGGRVAPGCVHRLF